MNEFLTFKHADLNHSKVKGGFWGHRTENYNEIIDSQLEALLCPTNSARLLNFGIAAGEIEGEFFGSHWSDGDCYKFLEACCYVYQMTGEQSVIDKIQKYIDWIFKSQQEDGYINTQITLRDGYERWTKIMYHELYNIGHYFTLAVAYERATGDDKITKSALRLKDYLLSVFSGYPKELAHFGFNPSQIMGLCELHQLTGDDGCWKLAEIFVNMRGTSETTDMGDQNQDRTPLREETRAVGHAVTSTYLFAGATDVYAQSGEKELFDALERIWVDIMTKRSYITGASSPDFIGWSQNGDATHESHAFEYVLPNKIAYNESCANIGQAMWAMRMLAVTGNAQYGDWVERIMYNAGISGSNLSLTRYFYSNPLSYRKEHPIESNYVQYRHKSSVRWHTFTCWCCPPQLFRTMAGIGRWVYGEAKDAVYVNLFANCDYDQDGMQLEMRTEYPWDETITIKVNASSGKKLMLRVPAWCKNATINGAAVASGCYASVDAKEGDVITMVLPMEPVLMQANPNIEADRGMLAVMRGPIVYCAEGIDNTTALDDIYIDPTAKISATFEPDLLDGVVTLSMDAAYIPQKEDLYYEYSVPTTPATTTLKMIPYYAWANRDECDMSIWFPKV